MEYHKIQTVFKRDPATKHRTLLDGEFSETSFAYLASNEWTFTEKVDGTNIRLYTDDEGLVNRIGGRTDNAQIPTFLLDELSTLTRNGTPVQNGILFGEGYGPKIQKGGGNYRDTPSFVLFDVFCGIWLERGTVEQIGEESGLDVVPVIGSGTLADLVEKVSDGFKSQWGDFQAEGIVARPRVELLDRRGRRVITKLKCKDYA